MSPIMSGWPDDKLKTPLCVSEHWPYREELTTQNGIVCRETRIIIPASMRREMKARAIAHIWESSKQPALLETSCIGHE